MSQVGGEPGQLAFNDILWKAVDLVKDKGYVINNIDLLITGQNTNIYRIYMSHPEGTKAIHVHEFQMITSFHITN